MQLPNIVDGRTALLLLGIVVAGLAAEVITRLLLSRLRVRTIDRLVGHSPLGAFGAALLLDVVALVALFIAGRVVLARLGDAQGIGHLLGQQVFQALFSGAPSISCSAPSCGPTRRKAASPRSTMPPRVAS